MCAGACVGVYALKIVFHDNILRYRNALMTIIDDFNT